VSTNDSSRDLRTVISTANLWISVIAFISMIICFALLQASFKTWAVGRFFAGRAGWFVDAFLLLAAISVLTGFASLYAHGKQKLLGVLASVATILGVVLIFWINP
jgi:hypothetical protein